MPVTPGSFIFSADSESLYLDTKDKRVPLSPVQAIHNKSELGDKPASYVYVTPDGAMFLFANGAWHEYAPATLAEATYMYRFEVSERVSELRFSADTLGVSHAPEFDVLDANKNNISGSEWIRRRWDDTTSEYVLSCSGDWPIGTYYLKLSYNVRYDSEGSYIQDDSSRAASITLNAGEHYTFTNPLTSLTINVTGGRGRSSVSFVAGSGIRLNVPTSVKFLSNIPTIKEGSEYFIELQGNIMSVREVVSQQ